MSSSTASGASLIEFCNKAIQVLLVISVAVTPLLFSQRFSELFEFPKMLLIYMLAIAIFALWASKQIASQRLTIIRSPLLIPVVLFLVWLGVASLLSLSPYTSLVGYYSRFNGSLASYLAYLILAHALLDQIITNQPSAKFINQLLTSWTIAASLVAIWAILEHFGHDPSCVILRGTFTANCWVQDVQARVFSTFGQPNWLATYLVASLPISLGLLLNQTNTKIKVLLSLASLSIYAGFWYTYSRSGWFGLIAAVIVLLICLPWSKLWQHRFWLGGIILGCILISVTSFNLASLRVESSLSGQGADSSTGQIRLLVWQGALEIINHHPILGTGPETFAYSFLPYRPVAMNTTTEWNFLYNEAHNQVLNTAATMGIVGLVIWLSLFIPVLLVIWFSFRLNFKHLPSSLKSTIKDLTSTFYAPRPTSYALENEANLVLHICLAAGVVGVFIAQLFGFAVVMTNLLLFISLAIIIAPAAKTMTWSLPRSRQVIMSMASATACLGLTWLLLNYSSAEMLVVASASQTGQSSIAALQKAIQQNPWEPQYRLRLANTLITNALVRGQTVSYQHASQQLQKAQQLNPYDLIVAKSITYYYRTMAKSDPSYQKVALASAQRAVQLAPTDADARQTLADIQLSYSLTDDALTSYNQLIELRPVAESYLKRAEYYRGYGTTEQYRQDLVKALQLDPHNQEAQQKLSEIMGK